MAKRASPTGVSIRSLIGWSFLVLFILLTTEVVQIFGFPRILSVTSRFRSDSEPYHGIFYAVGQPTKVTTFEMRISHRGFLPAPRWYSILHVGDVDRLTLGGHTVLPEGRMSYGIIGPHLRAGDGNVLRGRMSLTDPLPLFVFGIHPSIWNPVTFVFLSIQSLILVFWLGCFRKAGWLQDRTVWRLTIVGALLRELYYFATPYFARAYDFRGHIDYVQYLSDHWSLPITNTLWEAYQMPLYYLFLAPLYRAGEALGMSLQEIASVLQITSVVFTVLMLVTCVRLAERLFQKNIVALRIATFLFATFPGLIFFSSQITNDVLVTLVGLLWSGALILACQEPGKRRGWVIVGLLCGLGMLAKMSAAPWVGISALAALCVTQKHPLKYRIIDGVTVAAAAFLAGGWLYPVRALTEPKFGLIANAFNQWGAPPLPLTITSLFGFNPIRLLAMPFRQFDAHGLIDGHFYIEDILRTAHFGSVQLSPEAALVYVLLVAPLVCFVIGAVSDLRQRRLTLILQILGLLAAGILMRLQYPFPPSQHFRYIAPLILPCILLTASGASTFKKLIPRAIVHATTCAYAIICASIVFVISLTG